MSPLSRAMPVPDAALGALAYVVEAVLALRSRPGSHPRLVIALGAVVAGLALAGAVLIGVQVLSVHTLCMLCLCSAAISWINAGLCRADIVACLRLLRRTIR
jgi:hypothetical protein